MLRFDAVLWKSTSHANVHFVTVPDDVSEAIEDRAATRPPAGFGSVRVRVTVGSSVWETSVFPESDTNYVLPIKKPVRVKESLVEGGVVAVTLAILD